MAKQIRLCSVEGCERQHTCRGYCGTHYSRFLRHGDPLKVLRELKPRTDGIPHGTSHGYGYYKCRCDKCRDFARRRSNEWARKNPNRIRLRRLERDYGLRPGEYEQMLASQGGACRICRKPPSLDQRFLHVDHDHETGAVRGLLCPPCNKGLGMFCDDPDLLRAAAEYLLPHKKRGVA